jgi:outer membrane protein assembly factor BamB
MKFRLHLVLFFIVFALFATACTGGRGFATSWPGLTTDGETIYLASGSHVYAINAANGAQTWIFPEKADNNISFYAAPTIGEDGELIVGGYNNVLYYVHPQQADPVWSFDEARNRYIGSPLFAGEVILAPSADRNLYALDLNGAKRWSFMTDEAQWSQPATDGKTVYLTSLDHHLYAVDLATGRENWHFDLKGASVGTPLVVDGMVYAGSFAKTMTALDADTGKVQWVFPTSDWVWGGAIYEHGTLYFGSIDGSFYAVDALTGQQQWTYTASGGIFGSPLLANGKIYFATENGNIYAFDTNGELLWSEKVVGKIYTTPISVKNLILVALMESDKLLIAYDENKVERWSFTPGK